MKKSFSARRVPRKIGLDEEVENGSTSADDSQVEESALQRPVFKARKSSSLRRLVGPSSVEDDADTEAAVVVPKRTNISRVAIERHASNRASALASELQLRGANNDDDRPSYSASYLQELKDSTPTTPRDGQDQDSSNLEDSAEDSKIRDLDIASKFGRFAQVDEPSNIPSATEIAEKKARRARLAKEQQAEEYISLDVDDPDLDDDDNVMRDEDGRLVLKPKDKYKQSESRLVRDDEDVMENFDDFTEDGGFALGRKAEAEAARRRKQEMATQIAEAEGLSESDSDTSERERNQAFEAAQTRHGTSGQTTASQDVLATARPRTPPVITPLPTVDGALDRLRKQLAEMKTSRAQKIQEMDHLKRERERLAEEEVRIQTALNETYEKFKVLRKERGIPAPEQDPTAAPWPMQIDASESAARKDEEMSEHDDYDDEDEGSQLGQTTRAGLGSSL